MKSEYGVMRSWTNGHTEFEPMTDYESACDRVKFYRDEGKEFDSAVVVREVGEWEEAKESEAK